MLGERGRLRALISAGYSAVGEAREKHTDFLVSVLTGETLLHTCHDDLFSQYMCSSGRSSKLDLRSH